MSTTTTINAKELRGSLPKLVERVRKGARFVVIYRRRPAFQIIPVDDTETPRTPLEGDSMYHAIPVGRSTDGRTAAEHDDVLYGP
jgi:antitoxin (DNA-binding transcriptional repressor) of toxin-antitoxin stability system